MGGLTQSVSAPVLASTRRVRLLRALAVVLFAPLAAWCLAAILLTGAHTAAIHWLRWLGGACFVALLIGCGWKLPLRGAAAAVVVASLLVVAGWSRVRPSNEREWAPEQSRLAWAEIDGSRVTLHGIRNFRYRSASDWDAGWYDAVFDTDELEGADYLVVQFSERRGPAHTIVSFRFAGERFVTFSVEVRKEQGESYGLLRGLFRQFELVYLVADERDAVQLRTNHLRDEVFLYPATGSKQKMAMVFMALARRLNDLREEAEFYNTLTNNCTTNLVLHWERINDLELPRDHRILLPGYSDDLAYEYGIIERHGSFEETRARARIGELALAAADEEDFSLRIRARPEDRE